jgi:pantothenate kinase
MTGRAFFVAEIPAEIFMGKKSAGKKQKTSANDSSIL